MYTCHLQKLTVIEIEDYSLPIGTHDCLTFFPESPQVVRQKQKKRVSPKKQLLK